MLLSEALDGVSKLVAAFPNGGQAAGKAYIGALAAVLLDYPRAIAARCVDPKLGVARETRFLPTVADLVAFCERETASMRRPVEHEDREARILREMAERRDQAEKLERDRAKRPTLQQMQAEHGPNWGLDAMEVADRIARERSIEILQHGNRVLLEREHAHAGTAPAHELAPSPYLRKMLEKPAPAGEAG